MDLPGGAGARVAGQPVVARELLPTLLHRRRRLAVAVDAEGLFHVVEDLQEVASEQHVLGVFGAQGADLGPPLADPFEGPEIGGGEPRGFPRFVSVSHRRSPSALLAQRVQVTPLALVLARSIERPATTHPR